MTILCISTFFKGQDFLKTAKLLGNTVLLLTHKKLEDKPWPRESIDEFFYLEEIDNTFETYKTLVEGTAYIFKERKIELVVALDDFDIEKAALVRETFRIPGMGQSTARYFRDKLAMRLQAKVNQIPVPRFSALFNNQEVEEYLNSSAAPWLIKPRSEASATGIQKAHSKEEAWEILHQLGENRHQFLIEEFKPGKVYHIDSLVYKKKVVFERCSQYLNPPLDVAHGGGIFRSITVEYKSQEHELLSLINHQVIKAFNLQQSAVHTEVIRCEENGEFYFLETASRVGGAHLAEMVEASSGINLWKEWAKIENAVVKNEDYILPNIENKYSGILITLSGQQIPDMHLFNAPEIVWTMNEEYHIGVIVKANIQQKVLNLLEQFTKIILDNNLHAFAPAPNKPIH